MHKYIAAKNESKTKSDLNHTPMVFHCFSVMTLESLIIFTVDSTVDMKYRIFIVNMGGILLVNFF